MTSMPERKSHDQEAGLSRRTVLRSTLVVAGAGRDRARDGLGRRGWPRAIGTSRIAQSLRDEEIDQPLGLSVPGPDALEDCLKLAKDAGFDGIELNYDLENDLSPKAGPAEFRAIRKTRRGDRHRHQRPLFVSLLAVLADRQRSGATGAGWSWPGS